MMKKAEAAALKVGAPFYGYANGDILFTEDLIVTLRLLREGVETGFFRHNAPGQGTSAAMLAKRHPLLQCDFRPFSGHKRRFCYEK